MPWIALALAGAAGLGIGLALGRRSSRDLREHAHDLEERLQIAEEDMARYRTQVSDHFGETSRLLRELTLQYRSVYEHLAEGARTLCPDGTEMLAPSLAEAALPAEAAAADAEAGNGQLDLDLSASGRWSAPADGSEVGDLGPLLDERLDEPAEEPEEAGR
jgi:uncharacterized membrane-anchored protein YhcB (DUF1043 family)